MTHLSYWIIFNIVIVLVLILDLGVFHKKARAVTFKESITWTIFWIVLALIFNLIILKWQGTEKALAFLTGYLIEKSLSIDNIFVFLLIFRHFDVPSRFQHRVLFWGVLGALIMRAIFIFTGVELLRNFHWIIYIFGAFLIITGIRMGLHKEKKIKPGKNPIINFVRKIIPVSDDFDQDKFFTYINNRKHVTPLFFALIMIETTDLIFALDSIPAILAITTDQFIVYTSNVFAILGLRSLYFVLAGFMGMFRYLHYGLAAILVFVGIKMMLSEIIEVPTGIALLVVLGILVLSTIASIVSKSKK